MSTPLYDELVVKYYLSKGIRPFSYPHEPVLVLATPKVEPKGTAILRPVPQDYASLGYVDLTEPEHNTVVSYDYFRL